jgi:hypothetical protein
MMMFFVFEQIAAAVVVIGLVESEERWAGNRRVMMLFYDRADGRFLKREGVSAGSAEVVGFRVVSVTMSANHTIGPVTWMRRSTGRVSWQGHLAARALTLEVTELYENSGAVLV